MANFDSFNDAPFQIRSEGQTITLKFDRTGPTTGRVSWNIPTPSNGCSADDQAYCGIVITSDNVNVSIETNPVDGTIYASDPTVDRDLHVGDSIATALVIGAFYHDRTTTFFDVTGLTENTPYFVSGYAVDCQNRYHTEGVHAYSLDYGDKRTPDTAPTQTVTFTPPVNGALGTGLTPGINYPFTLEIDGVEHTINIDGSNATTYSDLIEAINNEIEKLSGALQSPVPPNTSAYWFDNLNDKLFQWDGSTHIEIPVIIEPTDPTNIVAGEYWYNPTTSILSIRLPGSPGSWMAVTGVIKFKKDPTMLDCQDYWYKPGSPSEAFQWNGSIWCLKNLFEQATDPSLAVLPVCGTYWFNPTDGLVRQWDDKNNVWINVTEEVIYWNMDPNSLDLGTIWFDSINQIFFIRTLSGSPAMLPKVWTPITNILQQPTEPSPTVANSYWYDTANEILFLRNNANTAWITIEFIDFNTDPTIRESCDLWWDFDGSPNQLFTWDINLLAWVPVLIFIQSPIDPAAAPVLTIGQDVWYDTTTKTLNAFTATGFELVCFIELQTDPVTSIITGAVWNDTTNNKWFKWSGTAWVEFNPVDATSDPTMLPINTFWYDSANDLLFSWNGISFVPITFSTKPLTPIKGELWFDTTTNNLMEWNGTTWVISTPLALSEITSDGKIIFTNSIPGSFSTISLPNLTLKNSFWTQTLKAVIEPPLCGKDGLNETPGYSTLGIGDDGSPDERRELSDSIRRQLGYPQIDVELDKYQLDTAITAGIESLRKRSSSPYHRRFFFMNITPGVQQYILTNKAVGYDHIQQIMGIYRVSSSFLTSANGSGVFGQVVLQHLYNMGTFDVLSFHMVSNYINELEHVFASRIAYHWMEDERRLWIHQAFSQPEVVLLDCSIERTEQSILKDRFMKTWIEQYALSECRLMLSEIRGKFASLPGAGGGIALNAAELAARADADKELLYQQLEDRVVNNVEEWGIGAELTWG